jgi:hypothetical protein
MDHDTDTPGPLQQWVSLSTRVKDQPSHVELKLEKSLQIQRSLTWDVLNLSEPSNRFVEVAFLARWSLFSVARMLDFLKKRQAVRCLLRPRLSVALSQEQP